MSSASDSTDLKRFGSYVALAIVVTVPGLSARLLGMQIGPLLHALLSGVAILAAGFLLSWGMEAAEEHVSRGFAVALLALLTVLPEYAVDVYYTLQAGRHIGSDYVQFAAANMTGANRLLVGFGWPLIVLLFWWRSGKRNVQLSPDNVPEIVYLSLASLYSFVITLKGRIDLLDTAVLAGIFAAYLWRLSKLPKDQEEDNEEVGPSAVLARLPRGRQFVIIATMAAFAGLTILAEAAPFAESLVATGTLLGINKFLLIQWVAPLAGESPEIIITILFTLSLKPTIALGALISDKINQWTLLVGALPLFYSLGAGTVSALPLDARQHEEFFLTAAQSLFAVALLLRLQLSVMSALVLLVLFLLQVGTVFVFRENEARTVSTLTGMAWMYLLLALGLFIWNRTRLANYFRSGLLNHPASRPEREAGEV